MKTVLVADDESAIRELVRLTLFDYNVILAEDGNSLRKIVQEQAASISLIIVDLRMPGWQGYADAEKLHKETKIPVIVLTGYLCACPGGGARLKMLLKPFVPSDLVKLVDKMARNVTEEQK